MRHGYAVPDDHELEQVGQEHADTAAKLREIELRALRMSGRLDELRAEVGLEPASESPSPKAKIIAGLNQKASKKA